MLRLGSEAGAILVDHKFQWPQEVWWFFKEVLKPWNFKTLRFYFTIVCNMFSWFYYYFSIWVFFHDHSRITEMQGKGEGISLAPHYHFHPLHRHLDITQVIAVESSPLYIGSSRARTRNLWFPSTNWYPLSYTPSYELLLENYCNSLLDY